MSLRTFFGGAAMLVAALASTAASAQVNVYGRIDIGGIPTPPSLIFPQPVIIAPPRVVVQRAPIYLHVPPGHSRHWSKHCHRYNACGQPVYFVQNDWYQTAYRPHHYRHVDRRVMHSGHPGPGPHRDVRHDRRDDRDSDRGHGHGRGHGKGHDKHHDKHQDKHHGKGHDKH